MVFGNGHVKFVQIGAGLHRVQHQLVIGISIFSGQSLVNMLGFSGQLNITPKWKITLTTGWDFTNNEISYTSINVYRDLHCWEMSFGWIPKGAQQSWNFSINVKASVLQDMKLNKKKDFRDFAD